MIVEALAAASASAFDANAATISKLFFQLQLSARRGL